MSTESNFQKALASFTESGEITTYVALLDLIKKAESKALAANRKQAKQLRESCHQLLASVEIKSWDSLLIHEDPTGQSQSEE